MRLRKQKRLTRGAGVLLPVASLPSPHGIGTFGPEAVRFLDFLQEAGQRYWQVLPLNPTGYGDSPYQSDGAFAGNPYYIDLDELVAEGLLLPEELEAHDFGDDDPSTVDYEKQFQSRYVLLGMAFARSHHRRTAAYQQFREQNDFWLEDYSLYMAVKSALNWQPWQRWPEKLRFRDPEALDNARQELSAQQEFWRFCQYRFAIGWHRIRQEAEQRDIQIIGDLPIYVALDSADVWANPHHFQLDETGKPTAVAGVPPDLFSETGQLWGNPLYHWEKMEEDGFLWWRRRIRHAAEQFHLLRIDHFIGIVNYYAIPAGDKTAANGEWIDGPGDRLLHAIQSELGRCRIIAEDLGVVTRRVTRLRQRAGYPGMKLLLFAFEGDATHPYLPHNFEQNAVVYAGTHDNLPLGAHLEEESPAALRFARRYLGVRRNSDLPWAVIRAGYASAADVAVFQMQDLLELDSSARTNLPSTLGGNWCWRLQPEQMDPQLAQRMRGLALLYGRTTPQKPTKKSGKSAKTGG